MLSSDLGKISNFCLGLVDLTVTVDAIKLKVLIRLDKRVDL